MTLIFRETAFTGSLGFFNIVVCKIIFAHLKFVYDHMQFIISTPHK